MRRLLLVCDRVICMPATRRHVLTACAGFGLLIALQPATAQRAPYRTLNDTFAAPHYTSLDDWNRRAAYLREHILASAGLLPIPERAPLGAVIFGEIRHPDYTVSKAYFESLPGFFVAGNLYRPIGSGPFPAILSPHGHWPYGRLENTPVVSAPGRAINLARQGFVVFTYDMVGYNDSRQLTHTFGGQRENLWGLSLGGLQLWNGIRGLDFLQELPYVRRDALGVTGESGGGTQTFLLAAVDDRVAVAAPVNMISFHMQGGDLCENLPGLRLDTNNVEIAATIAPRPLLMVSATGDWTANTMEQEYPAVRSLYSLFGAADRVYGVRFEAVHNFNRESREAMYAWMARWLQQAPADVQRPERPFTPEAPPDVLVFYQRPLPPGAVSQAEFTSNWIDAAKRQLAMTPLDTLGRALRHALGFGEMPNESGGDAVRRTSGVLRSRQSRNAPVLIAASDAGLEREIRAAGFTVESIAFTPFDAAAASKVQHFDTYNRTAASQRVADIVAAMRASPDAALVASGDEALAALLAAAIVPGRMAILDVGTFDTSSDTDFLDRLYVPGLRRAGDLTTAAKLAGGRIVIHNAGERFTLNGASLVNVQRTKLSAREIAALLHNRTP
jgi:dienelactone hydrolase